MFKLETDKKKGYCITNADKRFEQISEIYTVNYIKQTVAIVRTEEKKITAK